jgi:type 2 lantibiotic biosynthesis protein LanM
MQDSFDPVLDRLVGPALDALVARLGTVPGLATAEREAVRAGTGAALRESLRRKVSRVLVLEVNAARLAGRLTAADPRARWEQWLATATGPGFWESLAGRYPTLRPRLRQLIDNRCAAAVAFARRFAADRHALAGMLAGEPELAAITVGAGDSHRAGQTVTMVECAGGRVVYKPRSVRVDAVLDRLLVRLLPDEPPQTRIRVPPVLVRDGYGWAAYQPHRYCDGDAELRTFYRGLGHWLAVMRLLGGRDLHAENLIAAGPVPVVVDCETLFTPRLPAPPSGYGRAVDRAAQLVDASVLRTGLLPGRGVALGWRGVDVSAAGSLPGQQPATRLPVLVDPGTDRVRIGMEPVPVARAANHPCPEPVLGRYWDQVLGGFDQLTDRLRGLDRAGQLAEPLAEFAGCPVRLVLRDTEGYAELARMLWHPASLHDEPAARARAADVLARQAKNLPGAPSDPAVIDAEIDALLAGDVPMFTTTPATGWAEVPDLVSDALCRWRETDVDLDRQVIRATLVSAYLTEGWRAEATRLVVATVRGGDLDQRRRAVAAAVMRTLVGSAVRAGDRTATWIAPVLTQAGWAVQPLGPDLYAGASGLAVLLAGYLAEVRAGRAEPVDQLTALLAEVLGTIRAAEQRGERDREGDIPIRPAGPGGYTGIGSQIWGWLLLHRLGAAGDGLPRARALAALLPESLRDAEADLLGGVAGAVVPLLRLSEPDGDRRWAALAGEIGQRLAGAAVRDGDRARWRGPLAPDGLGGVAHGATGIGWALARLGAAELADAAFRYEESLYDPDLPGWRDLRKPKSPADAAGWCHGAGGIGIVAADLLHRTGEPRWADVLRRAAAVCWADGMGVSHTLCHGDLGNWEVLRAAIDAGVGPAGLDAGGLDAHVLTGLEDSGAVADPDREAFRPGLLTGLGGIAYQLLRMHPDCRLPSVLLPDPGPE